MTPPQRERLGRDAFVLLEDCMGPISSANCGRRYTRASTPKALAPELRDLFAIDDVATRASHTMLPGNLSYSYAGWRSVLRDSPTAIGPVCRRTSARRTTSRGLTSPTTWLIAASASTFSMQRSSASLTVGMSARI